MPTATALTQIIQVLPPTLQHILRSYLRRLRLPRPMTYPIHLLLTFLNSWRTLLLLLLCVTNLKSLPFSWHVRLFVGQFRHSRKPHEIRAHLHDCAVAAQIRVRSKDGGPKPAHPVFRPETIVTRAPLFEIDYNLHKSNSTYFADLDHSRAKLVARLVSPVLGQNALVRYGFPRGLMYPILGAVHVSFLREIKPYQRYEVRSRVLGWDRKWIVIGSVFVRRATKEEVAKEKERKSGLVTGLQGKEEVVFACVLNKYVIKCRRLTVPPELCFAGSGWFDVREEVERDARELVERSKRGRREDKVKKGPVAALAGEASSQDVSAAGTGDVTPALGPEPEVVDAAETVQKVAMEAGRRLSFSAGKVESEEEEKRTAKKAATGAEFGWSWDEIEAERLRGLEFAEKWLALDGELKTQYEQEIVRRLV